MRRAARSLMILGLALAAPAVALAIPQNPFFDVDRAQDSLGQRGDPALLGGVALGRRIAVVGSAPGGGILIYLFGRDGVPRGAVPLNLGEFAHAELASLAPDANRLIIVGTSDGDLFVARADVEEPRTDYQTSLARASDVSAVAVATSEAADYVALDGRGGRPPEVWALSPSGSPIRGFGSGGRRTLAGLRNVTALSAAPDGRTLVVGVLRPDFTTRVIRLDVRTGTVVRGADLEDTSSVRGIVWQGARLFIVSGADDGRDKLIELDPKTLALGKSRRLLLAVRALAQEPGGGATICGESADDRVSCRRIFGGTLKPLVPLGWGTGAQVDGVGVGSAGSAVVVGATSGQSRLAVGRDIATGVTMTGSGEGELSGRALAGRLSDALRSGRLPVGVTTPEAARVRVRLALGRRALDLRSFRVDDDGAGSTVLRLDASDRAAVRRARRGGGRAWFELRTTATDRAGNVAEAGVRAVLP